MRIHPRPLFLALAWLAMSAPLPIVGCAAEARPGKSARANSDLTKAIEAATMDEDANVRREAIYVLGQRGRGSSMSVVGKCVDDSDEMVRRAAIEAVGNLMRQGGENEGLAASFLSRALHDGSWENRYMALHQFATCPALSGTDADAIRLCLDEERPSLQLNDLTATRGVVSGIEEFTINNYNFTKIESVIQKECKRNEEDVWRELMMVVLIVIFFMILSFTVVKGSMWWSMKIESAIFQGMRYKGDVKKAVEVEETESL